MTFTEEWFGEQSQEALAAFVRGVTNIPGLIVEIGAWEGRSTVAMAKAAGDRTVHSVDTWNGSPGEPSADLASTPGRDVFGTWCANVADYPNVMPHRMDWRAFVPTISEPVALAFIDAEHSYREVRDNITALLPHMAPGGIICGDDNHHDPVRRAVLDTLGNEVYTIATLWVWQKPGEPTIAQRYATLCATPSDIHLHLPRFVDMVVASNAQRVIELGTRSGVSTVAWLHGLAQTGGHLWSVDIDRKPPIGDHPGWTFIQGDDESDQVLEQLPAPVDIVFIDTSHHYEHTLRELHLYRHQVRPGGLIVCHDTELAVPEGSPPTDPRFPVKRAIEQFITETGFKWTNLPDCYGLGIIKVEGAA